MEIPILSFLVNRLKLLLFHLIGYFKRALCCFGRRRRDSCEIVPLTGVGVVPSTVPEVEDNWPQWDVINGPDSVLTHQGSKKPCDIQEHIELYRQQTMALARKATEEQVENEANYFQDMTPTITKQKKIYVNSRKPREIAAPSLSLGVQMVPVEVGGELGEWVENPGWDDDTQLDCDETVDAIVREKRRKEREKRLLEQQQKRLERHGRAVPLGARIS
ncbi:Receptor-binding cancer antigen expressed on SiSo cells [Frankliniella fusca]|uniref:Receptor-binding cancer antigen expressed on SiSo cells n=1 Tax=Frankliniella fusca TaxID=407009 RepID=A0AAE1HQ13_9NEOP|nr:Receptor-binding cancer antigen expressed on SiSo cells [Frankliniella fusca]